jgi:hypothetical protein
MVGLGLESFACSGLSYLALLSLDLEIGLVPGRILPLDPTEIGSTVVAASDGAESASYLLGRVPLWPMLCLPWQRRLSPLNLG